MLTEAEPTVVTAAVTSYSASPSSLRVNNGCYCLLDLMATKALVASSYTYLKNIRVTLRLQHSYSGETSRFVTV